MNRIILIGNGFDLAHGLPTSYQHFIDWYWDEWKEKLEKDVRTIKDDLCQFRNKGHLTTSYLIKKRISSSETLSGFSFGKRLIELDISPMSFVSVCKFLKNICQSVDTKGWVDIENEYYKLLVSCFKQEFPEFNHQILNNQLKCLQNSLVEYLITLPIEAIDINSDIKNIIYSPINPRDISISEKEQIITHVKYWKGCNITEFKDKINKFDIDGLNSDDQSNYVMRREVFDLDKIYRNYPTFCLPDNIMLLNFNYTATANKYVQTNHPIFEINHIHGELTNPDSVIFGYGDELDENYKKLSNLNDNEYLRNFKSIKYLESDRYRKALQFMDASPYQVFIMGHSCGNSDRTFLNTLFEHKNCVSIKPYYFKDGEKDNYLDIVQNISRNFTDMKLMRDRVVNKTYCEVFSERVS